MDFTFGTKKDNLLENSEFVSGIVTGALIGLAIGILTAPRSGKDLRNKIAGAVSKQTDDIADKWDDARSKTRKEFNAVKERANDAVDKAANQLDKYSDEAVNKADDLTKKAENKADDLADGTKSTIDKVKEVFKLG